MSEVRHLKLARDPEDELTDDTVLWRYVPLKTLFLYLSGKVFIPSVETLRKGDPFEAEFYFNEHCTTFHSALAAEYCTQTAQQILRWILENRLSRNPGQILDVKDRNTGEINFCHRHFADAFFEILRWMRYAWCWFAPADENESAAMWFRYGKEGAAIKTTVGRLNAALRNPSHEFEYARMRYVDAPRGQIAPADKSIGEDHRFVLRPHFLKRAEYRSENEVRYVTSDDGDETGGLKLALQAADWIDEIILWPDLSLSEESALEEAVHRFLPKTVPCERSHLLRRYPLEAEQEIIGRTKTLPSDGAPREMRQLWPNDII